MLVEANLPERLKSRYLYIGEEDGFEEQAAMLCPCGCWRVLHTHDPAPRRSTVLETHKT
ncbi:hypothetical protein BRAO375_3780009 [Bradyrhizobium sp. ORS 375]|nr:hypothetical protein BRAO375_3780009 [Bradyrhizobium sp. ORS 375]